MTSPNWSSLPLLPLKCVLEHLSLKDTLAATSTCRHWRTGLLLYEGHRETLKLRVRDLEKSKFLTQLFRKHTKRLHIYLDCGVQLDLFMQTVLPKFNDTALLYEIACVGPGYLRLRDHLTVFKLRRPITESLLHAHRHTLQNIALLGCEISSSSAKDKDATDEKEPINSRGLSFINSAEPSLLLSKCSLRALVFSSLHHLSLEYDTLDSEVLENLSNLPHLSHLTLNLVNKRNMNLEPLQWSALDLRYPHSVGVTLNIIGVPSQKLNDIIQNVLVEDLPLVAIRVLFCKTLHERLIKHLTDVYHSSLRALTWVDAPADVRHVPRVSAHVEYNDPCVINPFILLCWRCTQLQKLVIHGYWIWQYDILGMIRLRHSTLQQLEISAIYNKDNKYNNSVVNCEIVPVLLTDRAKPVDPAFVEEVNQYLQFPWRPIKRWSSLHAALTSNSTDIDRSDYVLKQILQPFGVTVTLEDTKLVTEQTTRESASKIARVSSLLPLIKNVGNKEDDDVITPAYYKLGAKPYSLSAIVFQGSYDYMKIVNVCTEDLVWQSDEVLV